ncbi:amidase family protein [Colletotrichum plurivorum]|uniref:Amidase family protein n=1 Tax=Colletotrichum plurivorum TaxID=2175906 RepID=A0A8H6K5U2_9PEZI|nr:amidase family protein [Colletotrichum plurivorum]
MKSLLSHVAIATCLPLLTAASYQESFVAEFDGTVQLSPETLQAEVQTSLATLGLECSASSRYHFSHSVFQGASFNLRCNKDKIAQKTILSSVQAISGVKKAWPVMKVEPAIYRGNFPGASDGGNIDRRFGHYIRSDVSHSLQAKDEKLADTLSTHVDTGVARLHAANLTGSRVRIAVVDTGFDVDVPGLSKTDITYAHDLTDNDNDVRDNCSFHGTHVFGIIGAKGDENRFGFSGVAPDASYELYRIQPCGGGAETDTLINSFLEAASRGVDIISCSFGGSETFPEDPWSAVATRLFEDGIYVALPTGNGGPGIFSGASPASADAITSVGSSDNTITPFLTWEGNWTAADDGNTIRFVPGLPFDLPANTQLTIWSPNQAADTPTACQPLPDASDLPADLSNTALLVQFTQCWTDSTGGSVSSLTKALGIPYVIYYATKEWTVADGPAFFEDTRDPNLKAVVTVEYKTGVELFESYRKDKSTKVYLAHDASVGSPALDNRVNNLTGGFASSFSSWGPSLTTRSMPLFIAPGGNLLSTFPMKYGGYGVVSGTSQSTPFAAGVAALVKQKHPDYTPEEIQAVMATTARPVKWNDGKGAVSDFLAPVYQQGGGLLDAWSAVHSTTVLSTSSLSFNDTANRPKELTFTIKNTGTAAITYQLSHIGAGSGYVLQDAHGYNFTKAEAFPTYADISITPSTLKVEPGQSASVSVAVTKEPELAESSTRVSYFGGYVAIQADSPDINNFTLPYTGFGAPLSSLPIINRDASYLMAWNMASSAPVRIQEGRVFTCALNTSLDVPASFADNMFPGVWIDLVLQSRSLSVSIVDAVSEKVVAMSFQSSSADVWGPGNTWYWDGSDANKTFIPEGTYIWRVQALKLNGDPKDLEVYDTGKWVLKYASNGTTPAL